MNEYEIMFCLTSIVMAYDDLPESAHELEASMEKARKLVDLYAKQNAVKAGRLDQPAQ